MLSWLSYSGGVTSKGVDVQRVIWRDAGLHVGVICGSVAEPQTDWTGRAQRLTCMFSEGPDNRAEKILLTAKWLNVCLYESV